MKKELFDELLESVKHGAAIMKGTMEPSRVFHFPDTASRGGLQDEAAASSSPGEGTAPLEVLCLTAPGPSPSAALKQSKPQRKDMKIYGKKP